MKKRLVYTIAIDPPGSVTFRNLAKILASSLLRTYFEGEILIVRNTPGPLFTVKRAGLTEVEVPQAAATELGYWRQAWRWKYLSRQFIDSSQYDEIMYIDADCIALRNLESLFEGEWDIKYQEELGTKIQDVYFSGLLSDDDKSNLTRPGVNSGTLAIKAEIFDNLMEEWERLDNINPIGKIMCSDQASWNKLLVDTSWHAVPFTHGDIKFPFQYDLNYREYENGLMLHALGGNNRVKTEFLFGIYMAKFYTDPSSIFFNLIEF